MQRNPKLILFDIDGTLIYHVDASMQGFKRFAHAFALVYGVPITVDIFTYNGMIDRQMAWKIAEPHGITREVFLQKFPAYITAMIEYLQEAAKKHPLYEAIPDALMLVKKLSAHKDITLGLITGNAKRIADWKLAHTGLSTYFSFGLYGDEADDRNALAKLVFAKAKNELHQSFAGENIVVIGDTVHDIRCGKAIGAVTIAVTTGLHGSREPLAAEKPDFLVDSLMDNAVRDFLGV